MDITTENELRRMLKELTLEDKEACVSGGEYLYESLPNAYLAQKLSNSQSGALC